MRRQCIASGVEAEAGAAWYLESKVLVAGLGLIKLNVPVAVGWDTLALSGSGGDLLETGPVRWKISWEGRSRRRRGDLEWFLLLLLLYLIVSCTG